MPTGETSTDLTLVPDKAEQQLHLSREMTKALELFARGHHLTVNTLVQGAWGVLLSRYSRQADVIFGTVVAGRPATLAGIESTIGLFVNTLPVRVRISEDETVQAWLTKLQAQLVTLREYEYTPLTQLQEWRGKGGKGAGAPLFESLLVFENYPIDFTLLDQSGSVRIENFVREFEITNYPLTLVVIPREELLFQVLYDPRRFEGAAITRLVGHLKTLLVGMVENPNRRVANLPLLTQPEKDQLLIEWNDTQKVGQDDQFVHRLFESQVNQTPDAVAVKLADQQITYDEFNKRANKLARYLQRLGVGPEVLVGLFLDQSIEALVGMMGVLKAGGAYLPIDPSWPIERVSFILNDVQVAVLVTQQKLRGELFTQTTEVICIDANWEEITKESDENLIDEATFENLAYVIYTSGSTGTPKGVQITRFNLAHSTRARFAYYEDHVSRFLLLSPLSFDSSVAGIFWTLGQGGTLVVPAAGDHRDVDKLGELVSQNQISHLLCVPSLYSLLLTNLQAEQLRSLRTVIVAGETCPPQLVEKHNALLPESALFNEYGPTEATVWSSVYRCGTQTTLSHVPIGRPIPNAQLYVLDPRQQLVPIGVTGELYIGGLGVARGYLNSSALTAERFISHPFDSTPGARLYKTGDLTRHLPDGNLEFLGRADEQVKVRGYRIELGEIETVLAKHPLVEACAVVISEQDDEKRIVAYVHAIQKREEVPINTLGNDLRSYLKRFLPDYMLPSAFMILDKLPVTASGKVDRRALAEIRGEPLRGYAPDYLHPRNPIEEMVAEMMAAVLNREQVGVNDDFFELGGNSLIATQLLSRLREAFQMKLPLRILFETPTVVGIATNISSNIATGIAEKLPPDSAVPKKLPRTIEGDANLPLSFAQERMWFFDQLMPGTSTYNVPLAIRVLGPLDVDVLERSINEIIRRHEVLRTNFKTVEGRPVQVIAAAASLKVPIVDLRSLAAGKRNAELRKLVMVEADTPFDLAGDSLLRVSIFQLDDAEHVFLLMTHHIAFDGWSLGVLSREISALYTAFSTRSPSPLAELPIQYSDFAQWQRQLLQGEFAAEQLSYWRGQLAPPSTLDLPLDRPRSVVLTAHGATQKFTIPPNLVNSLKALGRREGVTLFMILLAAFKLLLYRYTGQEQITVGSPIANRNHLETEGLIGCFINSLALRTDLSDVLTFQQLLRRVREVTLGAYAHQDLPFEKLVEELQPQRDLSRTPLFQVMLIFQNAPLSIPSYQAWSWSHRKSTLIGRGLT